MLFLDGSFRRKADPACSGSVALRCGGFVPHEWPPANGLLGTSLFTPYKGNYYSFKIFHRFWLAKIPWLILHNQLALTKFGRCEQQTIDSMVYWLENVLIDGVLIWKRGSMGNIPSIQLVSRSGVPVVIHEWARSRKMTFTAFRRRNGCFSD